MKIKNKRASHVGMILSFVIFITFLIFLFSITQPVTNIKTDKQDLLEYLKKGLVDEVSADVTSSSLKILEIKDCVKVPIIEGTEEMNVIVKDEKQNLVESNKELNMLLIKTQGKDFFKVYYLETSTLPETGLSACEEIKDYNIGLTKTEKYVLEIKIINLTNFINENIDNYEEIKEKLKIPFGSEFGFSFKNAEGEIISTNEREILTDIYSEEIPIQYVDNEANIKPGFLTILIY